MNARDVALNTHWVQFFRERGYQPLPSRVDDKRPMCRFAEYWEANAPSDLFERFPTTNVQVMTGRFWGLLVIDLDGPEAPDVFASWGTVPTTWVTHSGGNGKHIWFTVPKSIQPMPKAFLWQGEGKHSAIERLCDKSLVMAPPSIHPKTGKRYQFADKLHSPAKLPKPANAPAWLLARKPMSLPSPAVLPAIVPPPTRHDRAGRYDAREVMAAIHDKRSLAASWGIKFRGNVSPTGWAPCHAIGREDRTPSAAMHVQSGHYVDLGSGTRLSFFQIAIAVGIYADFHQAITDLGARYCVVKRTAI